MLQTKLTIVGSIVCSKYLYQYVSIRDICSVCLPFTLSS